MTDHLLLVTVGPVQGFIVQARRTRDLWFGSHVLSEIAKAGAKAIADLGGELIFPGLDAGSAALKPFDGPIDPDTKQPVESAPNKILAFLPAGKDPADIARQARAAVHNRWKGFALTVWRECHQVIAPGEKARDAFDEQVDTFLEFWATWEPIGPDGYNAARTRAEQTIAADKTLRPFSAWQKQRGGVPKSSLDGGRETVLQKDVARRGAAARLRLSSGEQLDAVGLIKRAGGRPEEFCPLSTVAYSYWIANARSAASDQEWRTLIDALRDAGLHRIDRPDLLCVKDFPFDGHLFNHKSWPDLAEELEVPELPEIGERVIKPIARRLPEPSPYVACLVADGDRMGQALDHLTDRKTHRAVSQALSEFTRAARKIVEADHRGMLVYAGGDDVLAFITLRDALQCANALRAAFADVLTPLISENTPTLSVGIGVGHVMENMGHLLDVARRAEKAAKGSDIEDKSLQRNALAITLDKRSGGTITWRGRWDDSSLGNPADRFAEDIDLLERDRISIKKIYEARKLLYQLPVPDRKDQGKPAEFAGILEHELTRILKRTDTEAARGVTPADVGLYFPVTMNYGQRYDVAFAWTRRLIIAHLFAQAIPKNRRGGGGQ